ncbi:dye-decolorizing heme-containing peroxidase [Marasmius crinis-equi]|uniref:Dye-decolorizing heme-containing peroxidase n=1 Tax=Marasmius crinis-equi TaxID=585013 RepID=A0ABR3F632_9AGAR
MKLSSISLAVVLLLQQGLAGASTIKFQKRTTSLLVKPRGYLDLPTANQVRAASAGTGVDYDNVQSYIMVGMRKLAEVLYFFEITDVEKFKSKLGTDIHDRILSALKILDVDTQPMTGVNIAFSQAGLTALGIKDDLNDDHFREGQLKDAEMLGDPGTINWVPAFKETKVHGFFTLASDNHDNINAEWNSITAALGNSIKEVHRLKGDARPGDQLGHEHFGYLDGVAQPVADGYQPGLPGQKVVKPGILLVGEDGDTVARPSWAKGGSFGAFRQLKQYVPEYHRFLADNALNIPGLTKQENIDLLGARIVGRWKSGTPIDLHPLKDDPSVGADPQRLNNFTFAHPELGDAFDIKTNQTFCPFSAHALKSRPRAHFQPEDEIHHIVRAGIPFGPELTEEEIMTETSSEDPALERGISFVSYQSNIANGFVTVQKEFSNNPSFPTGMNTGVDGLTGTTNTGPPGDTARPIKGLDPLDPEKTIVFTKDAVVSRGGEYFFAPPISALKSPLSE